MRSIRSRLLFGILGSVLVAQMLVYLMVYARIEDEIDDLFDGELERSAIALSNGLPLLPVVPLRREIQNPQEGMLVSIWDDQTPRPRFQAARLAGLPRSTPLGFSKISLNGCRWRLFAAQSGGRFVVVAQPGDLRHTAADRITLRLLLPSLAVIPVVGGMIFLAVSFGLRPLSRISSDLSSRSHRDLSPIATERWPPETLPVVRALNGLMLRMADVLSAQRNFIADAAHELLTPLTALRLQARLLARADTPERRREMQAELQGGISRTLQLARQLLTLARHGADAAADQEVTQIDLQDLVRKVVAIHQPVADAKALRTQIISAAACVISGCEEALSTMVSNLVENAIKYTDSGAVRITLAPAPGAVVLEIEDSGPGIPAEERERVFDRFYRRPGQKTGGSGLGLAIAQEIATRHGASITLHASASLGGLCARVMLDAGEPGAAQQPDSSRSRIAAG
jgi:two-component system OmpR family sensor kinase